MIFARILKWEISRRRPTETNIVWFGEAVPMIEVAIPMVHEADIFVVVGTSLVVYPAAGLVDFTRYGIPKFIIDRKFQLLHLIQHLTRIENSHRRSDRFTGNAERISSMI
jgi:NAD-dependent SIR2 family protein deacetylase